jgi:FAD-dependent urate hydroxylase
MDTWRNHMPLGLFLKSEPYGSHMSAPTPGWDVANYSTLHGFNDYVPRVGPLPLDRFLGYADWFMENLVPDIKDLTVTAVIPVGDGFKVEFAEESPIFARQVIVATGMLPYTYVPPELSGLPAALMTPTIAHRELDQFRGKRVAVIGGGQSSLQTAALMHELGTDVRVVVREQGIRWEKQIKPEIGPIGRVIHPPAYLCEGWACVFYDRPGIFRRVPQSLRADRTIRSFGPAGAWWLRDRVEGVFEVLTGHSLTRAEPHGSGVRLHLDGPEQSTIDVDHVMAGTGFHINVSTLSFLSEEIKSGIKTYANLPLVNRAGETSVRGLYFAGAPTMVSLGAGVRFISGTHNTAPQLARSVGRRLRGETHPAEPAAAASQEALATTGPLPLG